MRLNLASALMLVTPGQQVVDTDRFAVRILRLVSAIFAKASYAARNWHMKPLDICLQLV